mgnify:FL=1
MVVALASLAIHATIFATASVGFDASKARPPADLADAIAIGDTEFSCWADASLALAASELRCGLPGQQSEACTADALRNFQFDWLLCDGLQEAPSSTDALAFLSPEDIANLEPMPILDVPEVDELELAKLLEEETQEKAEEALAAISNPLESGQVIEITAPPVEAVPDKARFLSEFDSHTEKETVARGSTEKMVAKPSPKELAVADKAKELLENVEPPGEKALEKLLETQESKARESEGSGKSQAESALLAMRELQFQSRTTAGDLSGVDALEANGLAAKKGDGARTLAGQQAQEAQEAAEGGVAGPSGVPNLRPSQELLTRVVGGGSVDKLDGVESGDFTSLNTKKWKFASFFNRMKRQVAQNWHPGEVYARRDPLGKVYGTKDRVTVLEVTLQPGGKLSKVVVLEESGVDFLDTEAVAAFRRAQPFPNPPSGLIASSSGLITFSFGFHFQVGAPRSGWKVFRQQ